jgi:nucleoid DNA-binding protein
MVKDLAQFKERNPGRGMGRDGLVHEVAMALGLPKPRVREVLDKSLEVIMECLESGKRVELRGFGSFRAHRANARRSYIPPKGSMVKVDAKWSIRFKTPDAVRRSLMEHLEE